jgi:hypothetical protein
MENNESNNSSELEDQNPPAETNEATAGFAKTEITQDTSVSNLKVSDLSNLFTGILNNWGNISGGTHPGFPENLRQRPGSHVNSGPTGHANVPGHANFSAGFPDNLRQRPGSHVNSGPTGHANVPGHANFSKGFPGNLGSGSHANSGPTGHANVPGHANFSKVGQPGGQVVTFPALRVTTADGMVVNIPEGPNQMVNINGFLITR